MVGFLVAAALAAAMPAPAAPSPVAAHAATAGNADPAIFVVHDADTTIYIFGTFHALDGQAEWFNDQVKDAFDKSDELVLETLVPEGPPKAAVALKAAPPPPLKLPVASSASFLATTRIAINAGKAQGMQVGNGADMVLRHIAEDQGKPVEGIESLQSQMNLFMHMPATAPASAPQAAAAAAQASAMLTEMQSAWKRGDLNVFVRMLGQLRQASPDMYKMMFVERNAHFADWIAARMQKPGTVFVAIGAGHLAGKDSVLVRLAERGIESQRVN